VQRPEPISHSVSSSPSSCETRTLFSLLINSALAFEVREIAEDGKIINDLTYLRIKPNVVEQISGIIVPPPGKAGYSALELDDLLLGHFESLGWYVKEGLIDFNAAYTPFRIIWRKVTPALKCKIT
jgi:hypothetical protein